MLSNLTHTSPVGQIHVSTGPRYSIDQFVRSARLPTLPEVAQKLIELAQQDDPDFNEVSRVIRSDPVVSGKVMTTVNSALLGFRPKVETIKDAVNKLGVNMIRTLLLSFHLAQHETGQKATAPILQQHWRSSLTQAVIAELLAERLRRDPAPYFLAAMLQDVGILAMLSEAPDDYITHVLERDEFPTVAAAERSHFGFSHIDVSAAIVKRWGLADRFQKAILHHHDRVTVKKRNDPEVMGSVSRAASLGTAVVLAKPTSDSLHDPLEDWADFLLTEFEFTPATANEIISEVNDRVREYSSLFSFDIGKGIKADRVVMQAKDMLQEIALANQLQIMSECRVNKKKTVGDSDRYVDELSGLYNRRYMKDQLQGTIELAVRKRHTIAMLFLDVDKFKDINDTYGHSAGDQAIRHVADWLKSSIRNDDSAVRMGGDEFLVVLRNINEANFEKVATRIAQEIPPLELDGVEIKVSLSVGGTFYKPVKGDTVDSNWLIEEADQSMYSAKKEGGGRAMFQTFIGSK